MVFQGDIKGAWQRVDASFLVTLAGGMFTAIIVLASSIDWAMKEYPLPLWSFFFGLVLASATISLAATLRSEFSSSQFVAVLGAGVGLYSPRASGYARHIVARFFLGRHDRNLCHGATGDIG